MKQTKKIISKMNVILYPIISIIPDRLMLKIKYFLYTGNKLNLKKPKKFTEKIQLYKLEHRDPLMTMCADKYKMREYLSKKGYKNLTPTLYQIVNTYEEIDFTVLPNKYVIKLNNGSGTNIIVDGNNITNREIKETIKKWKYVNTITTGREWAYKNIERKIIIEEFLEPKDQLQIENGIIDYKFMCFSGQCEYVWVDIGRYGNFRRAFYDKKWNKLKVTSNRKIMYEEVKKPFYFDEMLEISNTISKDFPFVRVDFYLVNDKLYIGELTFYPWSGFVKFDPPSFDYQLGDLFDYYN